MCTWRDWSPTEPESFNCCTPKPSWRCYLGSCTKNQWEHVDVFYLKKSIDEPQEGHTRPPSQSPCKGVTLVFPEFLNPSFWRRKPWGKILKKCENSETILTFSCCPSVFLWVELVDEKVLYGDETACCFIKWVVAKLQRHRSASQSSMELYDPWILALRPEKVLPRIYLPEFSAKFGWTFWRDFLLKSLILWIEGPSCSENSWEGFGWFFAIERLFRSPSPLPHFLILRSTSLQEPFHWEQAKGSPQRRSFHWKDL